MIMIEDNEKTKKLIDYYKNKGLLIVGLNDSQGVNTTSTFLRKGLLDYLAFALTSTELTPEIINAFSLTMNKTEHIDYFLKNNLSLEEIKLSQIYSAVSALEKVMNDFGLPKFFGNVGNIYRLIYCLKNDDDKINISSSLKHSQEPVVIYSSGINDLMREVGTNPFRIRKDFKTRNTKPEYNYAIEKMNNPYTLKKVIDSIEKNYNSILDINSNSDIYALGAYVPKALENEELNVFRNLIIAYNDYLSDLCKKYDITFVDTKEIGKKFNTSKINFHISTIGHNALANCILDYMYQNKIASTSKKNCKFAGEYQITNRQSKGVMDAISHDYEQSCNQAMKLSGYSKLRELDIAEEHKREKKVFQKVLKYKSN